MNIDKHDISTVAPQHHLIVTQYDCDYARTLLSTQFLIPVNGYHISLKHAAYYYDAHGNWTPLIKSMWKGKNNLILDGTILITPCFTILISM